MSTCEIALGTWHISKVFSEMLESDLNFFFVEKVINPSKQVNELFF